MITPTRSQNRVGDISENNITVWQNKCKSIDVSLKSETSL